MCVSSSTLTEEPEVSIDRMYQPKQKVGSTSPSTSLLIECQQTFLPDGWTRGGSHPGRFEMGMDDGMVREDSSASAFIVSRRGY